LVFLELAALDDVLFGDLLPGVRIDLEVFDAVTGLPIELVERDFLGLGGGLIQRDRASDEGETQKAFPIGSGAMYAELRFRGGSDSRR
jgi:hypothetical protein